MARILHKRNTVHRLQGQNNIRMNHTAMKTVSLDNIISKDRPTNANHLPARHRSPRNNPLRRAWIWIIPILAALSAIWLQAAVHGFTSVDVTLQHTRQVERRLAP
jgi:hypothetical protein